RRMASDLRTAAWKSADGSFDEIQLMVCDPDGKNTKKLGKGIWPAWSPDGKQILFTVLNLQNDSRLHVTDHDGKNAKQFLKAKSMLGHISPDGKRLVYMSAKDGKQERIHVCNADGSDPKQLTTGEDHFELTPRWATDGKKIFFNRKMRKGTTVRFALFVIDAD